MHVNNITIESKNDQLVVDSRLVSQELGIKHKNFLKTIRNHKDTIESAFGEMLSETHIVELPNGGTRNDFLHYWLTESQASFVIGKSRHGLSQDSIYKFKSLGFDFSGHLKTPLKRAKKKESDYCKELAKKHNGKREVSTIAGNIDILTSKEIIEVKSIKSWKHALGQVLVYGMYYPSHNKRIHLYGETQESFLEMVRSHCNEFGVKVTWEY